MSDFVFLVTGDGTGCAQQLCQVSQLVCVARTAPVCRAQKLRAHVTPMNKTNEGRG